MKIAIIVFIGIALFYILYLWFIKTIDQVQRDVELLYNEPEKPPSEAVAQQTVAKATTEPTFEDLLDAIEWVESKGDPNAIGDNGCAVGSFQIHLIYLRDVNRIEGNNLFDYDDRWSRKTSRIMVEIYTKWYASRAFDKTGDKIKFFEYAARCHNGGPDGWIKDCTKPYWEKVKARLELCRITE